MSPQAWDEAEAIFVAALKQAAGKRERLIQRACRGNEALRARVEGLLKAHSSAEAGGFLAAPTVAPNPSSIAAAPAAEADSRDVRLVAAAAAEVGPALAATEARLPAERPGDNLGPYKLLERIGEGGFGTVYVAEQEQPVRRRVALKVIKLGMDTRQVVARFEAERQALAMMDHPHIAKVFDAGATDTGRPYFVMELVRGIPITHYCDQNNLSPRERLDLFIPICRAVQHAHTKAVIHRDLKPSNVLVTLHDGKPVPKVIDFGIAKATAGRLTDKTIYTEFHAMIGTPAYMSPEQAELSGLDIDTRSDVYSLGVLLYELLTGTTPFDAKDLMRSGLAEMQRIIREVEPPKPSTRVSALSMDRGPTFSRDRRERANAPASDSSPSPGFAALARGPAATRLNVAAVTGSSVLDIARHRRTDPQSLAKTIRGDLDWIVMKCLEKDRTRRYETATGLAADVHRYLDGEPVLAAPPSRIYRLRKQLRRYRWPVGIAAGFVALIAVGLGVSLTLWRQASSQSARAAAVSAFLTDMLTAAEPAKAKGEKLTVREALDTAAKGIDERPIKDQPLVEAEIRFTIGSTYFTLGLYSEAEAQFRAADALQSRELGHEHPDTLRTRCKLAETLAFKSDYAGAAKLAEPTLEAQRRVLGPDDRDTLETMAVLGCALHFIGRYADAVALLQAVIDARRRILGENHRDTAEAMDRLGWVYIFNTYPDKAEPLHREALRIHTQELGEEHPNTLRSMSLVGASLHNQGLNKEAEAMFRSALEPSLRILGPEHPFTLDLRLNEAGALAGQGRNPEAELLYREVLEVYLRTGRLADQSTLTGQRWLAGCLSAQGEYSEAETLLHQALEAARERYGLEHGDTTIRLMCVLASVLEKQRKDFDAEQVARQLLAFQHRQLPRASPGELDQSSSVLIKVLKRRGASDEALQVEQKLLDYLLAAAHEPDASPATLDFAARKLLYPANEQLCDVPQALALALQATERSGQPKPRHLRTLAQAYLRRGDSARARAAWERAIALAPDDQGRAWNLNEAAWELLTVTPETLRDPAEALKFARRANELSDHKNPDYVATLTRAYLLTGDPGRATEFREKALALLPNDQSRAAMLNGAAWQLLTITPEALRDPEQALALALRANDLSDYKHPGHVDTLALAYFRTGDALKAIDSQKQVLELLPQDSSDRPEYERRLAEYQAAQQGAPDDDGD